MTGYCDPPTHSRFPKGKSGNPHGRPRRKKLAIKSPVQIYDTLLTEMERVVRITENGKPIKVSLLVALVRQFVADAAKGNRQERASLFKLIKEAAADKEQRHERDLASWVKTKLERNEAFKKAARHGLPVPPFLPHPDDIIINMATGAVEIVGPISAEQHAIFDEVRRLQNDAGFLLAQIDQWIADDEQEELDQLDWDVVEAKQKFFDDCQAMLPPSLRWKEGRPPRVARYFLP